MTPHEIRVTLQFFLNDIQEENYIDAVNNLIELYAYADRGAKLPTEHIAKLLQEHKPGIVKRLLRYMKHYEAKEVTRFLSLAINALNFFGINWPELATIKSSITANGAVSEALSTPLGYIITGMQDALRKGNDAVVAHRVIDLWRGNTAERKRASEMLADMKQLVLSWTERHLASDEHYDVQDGLNMIQVLPPEDWPELTLLAEEHKTQIMRYLLQCMRQNDADIVEYRVPKLREWGINWPELNILKRSADAILDKKRDDDAVLDEDERRDFSSVYRNRSEEAGGHRFTMDADEYVDYIENLLRDEHNNDQVTVELATLGRRRRDAIKNWPELAAVINRYKKPLLRIIAWHFNRENFGSHSAARSIDFASAIHDIGLEWPEIAQLIEKNKHKIVKTLLELIKDDYDRDYILHEINALKSYGTTWPELAVIAKSLTSGTIAENDGSTRVYPDDIRTMLMDMLKKDNAGIALYHIEQFKMNIENMPELEEFLDKRKTEYIKIMLRDLKDGREWKYGAVEQYLGRLEDAKVKWPELKIIRNSLNSVQPREDNHDN